MWTSRILASLLYLCSCISVCFPTEIHGPRFNPELQDQADFSNSTGLTLICSAWGIPLPAVRWIHANGNEIVDVKKLRISYSNGTLQFPPFPAEGYRQDIHAGVYRCVASNVHGTIISKEVHVRAVVKQFYEVHVYDEFVIKGNTAVLKCYIPSFVRDYIVLTSWTVESTQHTNTITHNDEKYGLFSSGELHIRNVSLSDGLHYRCHTRHRLTGETRSSISSGRLIVTETKNTVPPRLTHTRSSLTAHQGESVHLPCAAQGYPIPEYSWYRVKEMHTSLVVPEEGVRLYSGTLEILKVKVDDAGTYHCVVNNSAGLERTDTVLQVTVSLSIQIEPSHQVVDVGKSASFQCRTSGHPTPHITWWKDGRILVPERRIILIDREVLRVDSVQREDKGMYQCFAQNAHSAVQASAQLKLGDAAPQLLHRFVDRIVHPGSSLSLKCVASGNPLPTVRWSIDDHVIANSERFILEQHVNADGDVVSSVNISKIQAEHSGQFQCTASNKVGRNYHVGRVNVYGPPSIRPFRNVTTIAGNSLVIHCHVRGHPIHSVVWEKDGVMLPVNHRQKIFLNGTLLIHNVQRMLDAGPYTCIARDEQGRSAKSTVHILVLNPPKISAFYFPPEIQQGMRGIITCSVIHGDLPIVISWLKDDKPIQSNHEITIRNVENLTSTLIVHNISPRHNGNYTCTAINGASSVSHTAPLVVRVPPRWSSEPKDQSVVSGHGVTVNCQAQGSPTPIIAWKKSVGRLPEEYVSLEGSVGHVSLHANGSLTVKKATKEDEGYYLCQASSGIGAEISKVVRLKVHVPVYFELKSSRLTAKKGSTITLHCEANGDQPISFTWKIRDQRIEMSSQSRFSTKEKPTRTGFGSELTIRKTERSDSTEFTCVAVNAFGRDEMKIYLTVQEPPQSPHNVKILNHGSRSSHVSWMPRYDGNAPITKYIILYRPVDSSIARASGNVSSPGFETDAIVDDLRPALKYELRVAAQNAIGVGDPSDPPVWFTTQDEVPEGPPADVTVESIDSQTIRVQWKPPKKELWNGKLLGYHIGYREEDSEEEYQFTATDVDGETGGQFLLSELKKFTSYAVVVKTFNRIGPGPLSEERIITTLADVPSQAPREIACVPSSSQSLRVSWIPPVDYAIHGILRGYKVSFAPIEERDVTEYKSTTELNVDLTGLRKFTKYDIQVAASTDAGDGVQSRQIFCRTEEDVPGPPKDIKVLVMSSDAIIISWQPPMHSNGIVTKYIVYVQKLEDSPQMPSTSIVPATQLYHEARGLLENHHYEFWVSAATATGEGEKTHAISKSPISTVPARIASFPEIFSTERKADLKLPCRAVGIPTPDRDWLLKGQHIPQASRFHVVSDGSLLIKGIRNADAGNYTCRVRNIYATDEITHEVIVHASQWDDHPPTPPLLIMSKRAGASIAVSWKVTEDGLSPITGYILNYKREEGEWEEVTISRDREYYQLEGLACGTRYQLFMKSYNAVGNSEPSDMISVTTKGSVPEVPEKVQILGVNSTFVVIHPQIWPDGGCPIHTIITEYRERADNEWTLVSRTLGPMRDIIVSGLSPGLPYALKLSAHNDAGTTSVEYDIFTLGTGGEVVGLKEGVWNQNDNQIFFYNNFSVIVPLISIIITLALIFASAYLCVKFRRRPLHCNKETTTITRTKSDGQDETKAPFDDDQFSKQIAQNFHMTNQFHQSDIGTDEADKTEIVSPYAMCQLPSNRYADEVVCRQFHSNRYYDSLDTDDPIPVTMIQYSKVRKKSSPHNLQCLVSDTTFCYDGESAEEIIQTDYGKTSSTFSPTPDLAPIVRGRQQKPNLQRTVPDILDHYPDSSFSNKSSSDDDDGDGEDSVQSDDEQSPVPKKLQTFISQPIVHRVFFQTDFERGQ